MANKKHNNSSDWALPTELTLKIFILLPIKPLHSFKLVSKTWKSLISDPNFVKLYASFSKRLDILFHRCHIMSILDEDNALEFISVSPSLPTDIACNDFFCLGSSNGLVCFHCECRKYLYVWNPLTGQCRNISFPVLYDCPTNQLQTHVYPQSWFGYVPSIDDYKIFLVARNMMSRQPSVHAYSMREAAWREVNEVETQLYSNSSYSDRKPTVVLVKDSLHWLNYNTFELMRFDLVQETIQSIPIVVAPDDRAIYAGNSLSNDQVMLWSSRTIHTGQHKPTDLDLVILEGKLCLWQFWGAPIANTLDTWMLEEYGQWDSWKKKHTFHFNSEKMGMSPRCKGFTCDGKVMICNRWYPSGMIVNFSKENPTYNYCILSHRPTQLLTYVKEATSPFMYMRKTQNKENDDANASPNRDRCI